MSKQKRPEIGTVITAPEKTCGTCVHEFAFGLWNVGSLTYADAGHCVSYETLSDLTRYACSVCKKKEEAP